MCILLSASIESNQWSVKHFYLVYKILIFNTIECQILRDNPAISMIDDSDEEVLYGSDTEELLNISPSPTHSESINALSSNNCISIPNLIDTRTDEESD